MAHRWRWRFPPASIRTMFTLLLLLLVGLCIVAQVSTVAVASTIFVDWSALDDAHPCGTSDRPCASLGRAVSIANAGDTIMMSEGDYSGESNCAIEITFSLSIVGRGPTGARLLCSSNDLRSMPIISVHLPSASSEKNLEKTSLSISMENVTIQDCFGSTALVVQNATASFIGCSFNNNSWIELTTFGDPWWSLRRGGGAIRLLSCNATFENCYWLSNSVGVQNDPDDRYVGGAMWAEASYLSMANCIFSQSFSSGYAAALLLHSSVYSMTDVQVSDSFSLRSGNVYLHLSNGTWTRCIFERNYAGLDGGGIFLSSSSNTSFTDCIWRDCTADEGGGGGIFLKQATDVIFERALFSRCYANSDIQISGGGGAILSHSSRVHFRHTNFQECNAAETSLGGGALLMMYSDHNTFFDCSFQNCVSSLGGAILNIYRSSDFNLFIDCIWEFNQALIGAGAAIYNCQGCQILNSSFKSNVAKSGSGGGLLISNSTLWVIDGTVFQENSAFGDGGGIFIGETETVSGIVQNSVITGNIAYIGGGGFSLEMARNVTFKNVTVSKNQAYLHGGGGKLYRSASENSFRNVSFCENKATQGPGGAFYMFFYAGYNQFDNCIFINNEAQGNGGALFGYHYSGQNIFSQCQFTNNHASSVGGGVYFVFESSKNSFSECQFIENSAILSAGAVGLFDHSESMLFVDTIFRSNYNSFKGGAIVLSNSNSNEFDNCTWDMNRSDQNTLIGGAIYFETSIQNRVLNSTFLDNMASSGGAFYVGLKSLDIAFENCLFLRNRAFSDGGAGFVTDDSTISLGGLTTFRYNSANLHSSVNVPMCSSCIEDSNCSPQQTCSYHGICNDVGQCECNMHISDIPSRNGTSCMKCEPNLYPPPRLDEVDTECCKIFCDPARNCSGRGTCSDSGQCSCDSLMWKGEYCEVFDWEIIVILGITVIITLIFSALILALLIVARKFAPPLIHALHLYIKVARSKAMTRAGTIRERLLVAQLLDANRNDQLNGAVVKLRQRFNPYSWVVSPSEIEFKELIGSGSFGDVFRGILRGNTVIAIKVINLSNILGSQADSHQIEEAERMMDYFLGEIALWAQLKHPNIVAFLGACLEEDTVCVLSEFMPLGTLNTAFEKHYDLKWGTKLRILINVATAMADLHCRKSPILHRDLKSENVLLDANLNAKITDFGLSTVLAEPKQGQMSLVGTPYWMAPELIRGDPYGTPSDVYSFGILMWQVLNEKTKPWTDDVMRTHMLVLRGHRPAIPPIQDLLDHHNTGANSTPVLTKEGLESFIHLMRRCWGQNPAERPSFSIVLQELIAMQERHLVVPPSN